MRYTTSTGSIRTTCGEHRRLGYAMEPGTGRLVCRGRYCSDGPSLHETSDETLERHDYLASLTGDLAVEGRTLTVAGGLLTPAEALAALERDGMPYDAERARLEATA